MSNTGQGYGGRFMGWGWVVLLPMGMVRGMGMALEGESACVCLVSGVRCRGVLGFVGLGEGSRSLRSTSMR
eukprot:COSAG06_NODE_54194_length_296_cov_0.228426_1_plen_70_part_01